MQSSTLNRANLKPNLELDICKLKIGKPVTLPWEKFAQIMDSYIFCFAFKLSCDGYIIQKI